MPRISTRRELIVVLLLCAGLVGAAMRGFSAKASVTHDIGTLLMVMWVPAVGNIIGYLIKKAQPSNRMPPAFAAPFVAHARVQVTLDRDLVGAGPERRFVVLAGSAAFSARCLVPHGETWSAGTPVTLDVQFLAPAAALACLQTTAAFSVIDGSTVIGQGQVLEATGG